jgi:hypothetical protein
MNKHYLYAALIGIAVGVYLAGSKSTTGIYGSFIGSTAANLWTAGNTAGGSGTGAS